MSSNVGLSTPRGSGTSGYVQRNWAFMKPRNAGYGAPYPPVSGANAASEPGSGRPFKQRQPDKQILEHDRRRAIEVKVMEERERLEEENEKIEEEMSSKKKTPKTGNGNNKGEEDDDGEEEGEAGNKRVLSDDEIEKRCEALRQKLMKDMEEDDKRREESGKGDENGPRRKGFDDRDRRKGRFGGDLPPKGRRQFKSYQVHELAEAKIEESERLRRALGIREDRETGEISSRRDPNGRRHERER